MTEFLVESLYGGISGRPLVRITPPGPEPVMITPAETRALAWNLLNAAETADQDGFVVDFFQALGNPNLDPVVVLRAFRTFRERERERAMHEGRDVG